MLCGVGYIRAAHKSMSRNVTLLRWINVRLNLSVTLCRAAPVEHKGYMSTEYTEIGCWRRSTRAKFVLASRSRQMTVIGNVTNSACIMSRSQFRSSVGSCLHPVKWGSAHASQTWRCAPDIKWIGETSSNFSHSTSTHKPIWSLFLGSTVVVSLVRRATCLS